MPGHVFSHGSEPWENADRCNWLTKSGVTEGDYHEYLNHFLDQDFFNFLLTPNFGEIDH